MTDFAGFPVAAFDFYDDLEMDNTRSFWEAHKATYAEAVRTPMVALTEALAAEFGAAKVFRPHRDVRFAKDKTPYKTHQGAFVAAGPATGWYAEIAAPGFRVGAGFYHAETAELARIRTAIDDDRRGKELEGLLQTLRRSGFEVGGDRLKTKPRGYDPAHPRIDLLRHRSLVVARQYGFDEVIHSAALVDRVRADWRALRPLVEWVQREVA
ncbi:DUF2461 domain-containing protein [Nocardioides terrisoli]|uniref:DUF2461 domain-containing protein n=1 Tax=Nocardioides terrisoli TaxID=3388267 RepID=UPI00287B60B2|nr:DUF2461 domain-containing protein [Nocardioides marmorisolisilvae]